MAYASTHALIAQRIQVLSQLSPPWARLLLRSPLQRRSYPRLTGAHSGLSMWARRLPGRQEPQYSCRSHMFQLSAIGMLQIQIAVGRLHHLTSCHEASMWAHHHSHSTFLQLANRHQRSGHVRNLKVDIHRSSPFSYSTVFWPALSEQRTRLAASHASSGWTSGPQTQIRAKAYREDPIIQLDHAHS